MKFDRYKKVFENNINEEAYWINPQGQILSLGNSNHIQQMIKNPKAFGLSTEQIQSIYNYYKEPLGSEGKAREQLIKQIIARGWIRIRKYNRPDRWTINVNKLTSKTKDYIQQWAQTIINRKGDIYGDVYIDSPKDKMIYTITELSRDILYTENIRNKNEKNKLEFIEDVFEFTEEGE